jgi:NADH-quinone oxidoreductase subunit M
MPLYATFFMIATLASVGLPGLSGFIGEFMVLFGTFKSDLLPQARLLAVLGTTGVVLGAIYMLWMYQRVFYGRLEREANEQLVDLAPREVAVLLPIVVFIFWLGVRPGLVLDKLEASVDRVLAPVSEQLRPTAVPVEQAALDPDARLAVITAAEER